MLLAYGGLEAALGLLPAGFPRAGEVGVDRYVLLAALGAVVTAALGSGISQVWASSAPDLTRSMKDGGRGASDSASRRRFRSVLVGAQVALAAVLLTGGILLARSFADLVGAPLGMDIANVVSVRPGLPASRYDPGARAAFRDALLERLRLHPGVQAVSASNVSGMSLGRWTGMTINGRPFAGTFEDATPFINADAGIFDVLGLELAEGRWYREGEDTAAVVTGSFAARHYPDGNALGQEISWGEGDRTIVGVARDFRLNGPAEAPLSAVIAPSGRESYFLVRTSGDPQAVMNAIRGEVRALDPEVIVNQTTLEEALYGLDAVSQARLRAVIVTAFAVVALLLSLAGIAGVASHSAARRTQEIGVRLALGGTRTAVMWMMLRQTMTPVMVGIGIGAVGAAALTRVLSAYVPDLSSIDPLAFIVAATVLVLTAVAASYVPLRRGTAIHASAALRHE